MEKVNKMDIVKENPLFNYIKSIFTLINKDARSTVFLDESGLICKTNDISMKVEGTINDVNVFESLTTNNEYEICQLPGNIYRITGIGVNEEKESIYKAMVNCHNKGRIICDLEHDSFGAISKISIESGYCLKDSYAKSIANFGECYAFLSKNEQYIILYKKEVTDTAKFSVSKAFFTMSLEDIKNEKSIQD